MAKKKKGSELVVIDGWKAKAVRYKASEKDFECVQAMLEAGIAHAKIANCLMISVETLKAHFGHLLGTAVAHANTRVASALKAKALGEGPQSVSAAVFWLKARAGWKDTATLELTGPDGGPIEVAAPLDLSELSREERAALRHLIATRKAEAG